MTSFSCGKKHKCICEGSVSKQSTTDTHFERKNIGGRESYAYVIESRTRMWSRVVRAFSQPYSPTAIRLFSIILLNDTPDM